MSRAVATVLVAMAALAAVSGVAESAGRDHMASPTDRASSGRTGSALDPSRKMAREKALARCRKIAVAKKRKACVSKVKRRFGRPATTPTGPVEPVQVRDKFFSPDEVELPRYGSIRWEWSTENSEPHDITLLSGPKGVSVYDFQTPLAPSVNYTFERKFEVPGTYRIACSLHHLMTMKVEVGR